MQPWKVAIIGGGPGGLMTAYQLQKRAGVPFRTTIFEASGRLGGKILTSQFAHAPVLYESGAAELYDYSAVGEDPLRELVAELGLSTKPMGGVAVVLNERILASTDDIHEQFGPAAWHALERFDRHAKDWMSPKEFYLSDWHEGNGFERARQTFRTVLAEIHHEDMRNFVQTSVHSDLATEPELTSGSYGLQNYLMNDPAYMRLYSIDGGIERLPEELIKRLEATFLLNEPVLSVEKTSGGSLRLRSKREGAIVENDFDFVIVALPNNLLPAIEWRGPRLSKAMQEHHNHYDYPAHYLRVSILFEKPFWRGRLSESYFMLDAFGGCCLYDESARHGCGDHGVLGWLLGGEAALKMCDRSDEELIEAMLGALPAFLKHGRQHFIEGRVHRWVGAVNGLPSGFPAHDPDSRHKPEPAGHPNLFVVGDYLFDSTLNGVLDSADYVAEWLIVEMEERTARGNQVVSRRLAV